MKEIKKTHSEQERIIKFEIDLSEYPEKSKLDLSVIIPQDIFDSDLDIDDAINLYLPPALSRIEKTIFQINRSIELNGI